MAVKNTFGEHGKEIWDEIVSQGDNYDKFIYYCIRESRK